jgi:hypothetical protein
MSIDGGVPSEQAIGAHNAGFDAFSGGVAKKAKTIIGKIRTAFVTNSDRHLEGWVARRRILYEAGQIFLCLWYTA